MVACWHSFSYIASFLSFILDSSLFFNLLMHLKFNMFDGKEINSFPTRPLYSDQIVLYTLYISPFLIVFTGRLFLWPNGSLIGHKYLIHFQAP